MQLPPLASPSLIRRFRRFLSLLVLPAASLVAAAIPPAHAQDVIGFEVLHRFTDDVTTGYRPVGGLVQGGDAGFYGTTYGGPAPSDPGGAAFRITGSGIPVRPHLYAGNFYGSTFYGGDSGAGYVFSSNPISRKFTKLYSFRGGGPASTMDGVVGSAEGDLYGAATTGFNTPSGSLFKVGGRTDAAGTVQFAQGGYDIQETDASEVIAVSRQGGSQGRATVEYTTVDGTARAGADYVATSGTLTWESGDTAEKSLEIPIINRKIGDRSVVQFTVALSSPSGVTIGTPGTTTFNLTRNAVVNVTQPSAAITGPFSDGLTFASGSTVTLSANVSDPSGVLTDVLFYLNDRTYKDFNATGPFTVDATGLAPGTYTFAVLVKGSTTAYQTVARTFTIAADDAANPVPSPTVFGDYTGRLFFGGTDVVLSTSTDLFGFDLSLLRQLAFYYNGILIAAYDGNGVLLPGGLPGVAQFGNGLFGYVRVSNDSRYAALFGARFRIPSINGAIRVTTVATGRTGVVRVSSALVFQATTTAGTGNVTAAAIGGLADGATVELGDPLSFTVNVTGTVRRVDYYLNGLNVGAATAAPYAFTALNQAAGSYLFNAVVTDTAGYTRSTSPVVVQVAAPVPTIQWVVPGANGGRSTAIAENGAPIKLRVARTTEDLSQPLVVTYKIKGGARPDVNYRALKGTVTIPAGKSSAKVKIRPLDDGVSDFGHTVKLKLLESTDGSYTLGVPALSKVRILNVD